MAKGFSEFRLVFFQKEINLLQKHFLIDKGSRFSYADIMIKIVVTILMALTVVACGRMSRPIAPDGSTYPQTYIVQE